MNMVEKVRCAVIGVGRLGFVHATNAATRIPNAEVATIVASRIESAERAAREMGVQRWTDNPQEVFDDPSIDAVIIVSPTSTHAELITQAARSKKHIFVDKPLTETLEQADEVIKEISENNVYCQVGFMRRFDPSYAEAKRRIMQGDIGEPLYYKGVSRDPGSPLKSLSKAAAAFSLICVFTNMILHGSL